MTTTLTTVTTGWDKHADKMNMRKTYVWWVYCLHPPSIARRLNFRPTNGHHSSGTIIKKTVHSRVKISTSPSSTLTTSRCLVAIVMTKMKTYALWKKDSIVILKSIKEICVIFKAFKLLIAPLSDLLLWSDRFVSTSSDCSILMVQIFCMSASHLQSQCADSMVLVHLPL